MENVKLYKVLVDDNFHYQDSSERYTLGYYDTLGEAITVCKKLVDDYLIDLHKSGADKTELSKQYFFFGEDPWITRTDGIFTTEIYFSAWKYASQRIEEICSNDKPLSD